MKKLALLLSTFIFQFSVFCFAQSRIADHVIWIGIDGWGAYSLDSLYKSDIPNIRALMAQGAWTKDARTVLESDSGPNWMAQFSGADPSANGWKGNSDYPECSVAYKTEHGLWPTIFHVVRQGWPDAEIGVQHEWGNIKNMCDTLDLNYRLQISGNAETETPDRAAEYIKAKKPNLFYLHIDQLDHAGHSAGHHTPGYFATLHSVDSQIGKIIQAVKDAGIMDNTVIVLTADHGGIGTSHGGSSLSEMQVPVVYCGKGIKHGLEVTDVVVQFDVAATIAKILGVTAPNCWRGKATNVFEMPAMTITAHSGAYNTEDNSIDYIQTALRHDDDILEFDVRLRPNGTLAMSHDEIKNDTEGVDVADVLEMIKGRRTNVNLDIKEVKALPLLYKVIKNLRMENQVLMTGINFKDVEFVKKTCPNIKFFLNYEPDKKLMETEAYRNEMIQKLRTSGAEGVNCSYEYATPLLVKTLHDNGFQLSLWTLNDKKVMKKYLPLGPDNITTRHPDILRSLLK